MAPRKTIGIDLDDVLLDFNGAICTYHNERYTPTYSRDSIRSFYLEHTWDCTREEAYRRILEFYQTPEHREAPPVSGAQEALKKLSKTYGLLVVTAKPQYLEAMTRHWCQVHFPNVFQEICFTNLFGGKAGHVQRSKGEVCRELGVDIFIEDAPHHALDTAQSGIPVLLYDVPWNQDMATHPNITRVYSWEEIVTKLT